jgi:hypothetical protein
MNIKNVVFYIVLCTILLISCKQHDPVQKKKDTVSTAVEEQVAVTFCADTAYRFVQEQTSFGARVPGSNAHVACADYLSAMMKKYGDTVIIQHFIATTYDKKQFPSRNIITSFSPRNTTRVLLAAHWDSRPIADHDPDESLRTQPIDGANDGASGVGVLMEIARQLQLKRPNIGVDIIFFDVEDYGTPRSENIPGDWWCLGSQYWAKHLHVPNYRAKFGILLDMVGAPDATFYHEQYSQHFAPDYLSLIWGTGNRLGYGKYFKNTLYHPIIDDHYYVNTIAKIPMIDIIHQDMNSATGFFPHWHTSNDNINAIDKRTLEAVGETILHVLYEQ